MDTKRYINKWFFKPSVLTEIPVFLNELMIDSHLILFWNTSQNISIISFFVGGCLLLFFILKLASTVHINFLISLLTSTSSGWRSSVNPGGINTNLALCLSNSFDKSGSKWVVARSIISKELETFFSIVSESYIIKPTNK